MNNLEKLLSGYFSSEANEVANVLTVLKKIGKMNFNSQDIKTVMESYRLPKLNESAYSDIANFVNNEV